MKIKYVLFIIATIITTIGLLVFIYLYRNVKIYSPFTISICNLSPGDRGTLNVYTVSPFNKTTQISYNQLTGEWSNYYAWHKRIILEIPDTVLQRMKSLEFTIGRKTQSVGVAEFTKLETSGNIVLLVLPEKINEKKSVIHLLTSLLHWELTHNVLIICIIIIFFVLIFSFRKLLYKLSVKVGRITINWSIFILGKTQRLLSEIFKFSRDNLLRLYKHIWICVQGYVRTIYALYKRNARLIIKTCLFIIFETGILFLVYLFISYAMNEVLLRAFSVHFDWKVIFICIVLSTAIMLAAGEAFYKMAKVPRQSRRNFRLLIFSVIFAWSLAEAGLRITGLGQLPEEKNGLSFYRSIFMADNIKNHLMIYPPYYSNNFSNPEFSCEIITNREGLCDRDFHYEKQHNEFRIVGMGDSFTQGIGTTHDSAWPRQLEAMMNIETSPIHYTVINAGMGGSDPFYYYLLLKKRLILYHPDMIIYTFNQSDLDDLAARGGFERFMPDGTVSYRRGPVWEWLYATSYLARIWVTGLFDYGLGLTKNIPEDSLIRKAIFEYYPCFKNIKLFCDENKIKLLLVFHPQYGDFLNGNFQLQRIYDWYKKNIDTNCLNMYDYFLNTEKIEGQNVYSYYWKNDRHHNGKGYSAFARGVKDKLEEMGIMNMDHALQKNR